MVLTASYIKKHSNPMIQAELRGFGATLSRPTIRRGSTGDAVIDAQILLTSAGFYPGPTDGIFGTKTDSATRAFQSSRGLVADGIIGPLTWAQLSTAVSPAELEARKDATFTEVPSSAIAANPMTVVSPTSNPTLVLPTKSLPSIIGLNKQLPKLNKGTIAVRQPGKKHTTVKPPVKPAPKVEEASMSTGTKIGIGLAAAAAIGTAVYAAKRGKGRRRGRR
jgi:hypothetical protein